MKTITGYLFKKHPNADARKRRAINLVKVLLQKDLDILPRHRKEFLSDALWKLTEAESQNKHRTRFCSETARHAAKKDLRHDHVFQRSLMTESLLSCSAKEVDAILDKAVACTITKQEHTLLNQHKHLDGWDRYDAAKVGRIENEAS